MYTITPELREAVEDIYRPFTPKEVLEKALEELAKRGWTKGVMIADTGEVCALGAMAVGAFGTTGCVEVGHRNYESHQEAIRVVGEILAEMGNYGSEQSRIPGFNDMPNTTYEDVALLFKRGIEKLGENDCE